MYTATAALKTAVTSRSCGIVRPPTFSSSTPTTAAATMNSALRMLFAAITRERCDGAVRVWISANSGTMKKPEKIAMPPRSNSTRHAPSCARNSRHGIADVAAAAGHAKYRSTPNSVMPIEPNGTRPISTLCPDSFSHSSEPTATPMEKTVSSSVNTVGSPPSTLRAYSGSCVKYIDPKNQNHEMPRHDRNTVRFERR